MFTEAECSVDLPLYFQTPVITPDLTHYWFAAVDIPVASDNPVHYADAIRYNAPNASARFFAAVNPSGLGMTLM